VGAIPVDGASGDFDWVGFVPAEELPQVFNPERGYMNSGNNEVVDAEWYPYLFDLNYDSGWRAWRVEELINELKPIDMDDMVRITNDLYLKKAEWEVPLILKAIEDKGVTDPQVLKAYDILKDWDYEADLENTACAIFFKYAQDMRYNVFGDHVSQEDFDTYLSESHVDIAVEALLKKGEHPIFDDVTTPDKVEDMQDCMVKSIKTSMVFLEKKYGKDPQAWAWGKVHMMKFFHPLGFGPFKEFSVDVGPYVGGRMAIRNASPADGGRWHFKSMNGTSWRHIIDMGDVENARVMIDGSISGQWLSPHYDDLVKVWHAGDFLTATMDPENVKQEAKYHLVLTP
jgi:penicillin amidase